MCETKLFVTLSPNMPKPTKAFLTEVAKKLVQKYAFMKDHGEGVTGYVS